MIFYTGTKERCKLFQEKFVDFGERTSIERARLYGRCVYHLRIPSYADGEGLKYFFRVDLMEKSDVKGRWDFFDHKKFDVVYSNLDQLEIPGEFIVAAYIVGIHPEVEGEYVVRGEILRRHVAYSEFFRCVGTMI